MPTPSVPSDNTTLTAVLAAYQDDGYREQLMVDDDGRLTCGSCGNRAEPEDIELHSLRRLEGASDPDDMVAVLAVACPSCGAKGTLVVPFGPQASEAEAEAPPAARRRSGTRTRRCPRPGPRPKPPRGYRSSPSSWWRTGSSRTLVVSLPGQLICSREVGDQVAADGAGFVGRPEDGRGVIGDHDLPIRGVEHLATTGRDPDRAAEQGAGRRGAQADHHSGPHRRELGLQPRVAGVDLVGTRLLVEAPLAPVLVLEVLHGVGDVEPGAIEPGLLDATPEHAPRRPDERLALAVLLVAGLLADQDDPGRGRPFPEHRLGRGLVEGTALAPLRRPGQAAESAARGHEGRCRPRRHGDAGTPQASLRHAGRRTGVRVDVRGALPF